MSFPSAVLSGRGEKDCCAKVLLEKSAPNEVVVGGPFEYHVKATNAGNVEVRDVVVSDVLPPNFKLGSSMPQVSGNAGGKTMWNLGALRPGESKSITIKGEASAPEALVNCTTVTYQPYICVTTAVVQPALKLVKQMPADVLRWEPIPVRLTVSNTGTGAVNDVVVKDELPEGLVTQDNKRVIMANVGSLAAGQPRTFSATLKAIRGGTFNNTSVATGSGLWSEASASTTVREPVLKIEQVCSKKVYIGRPVCSDLTVANTGDGPAKNAVVEATVPRARSSSPPPVAVSSPTAA